MLSITKTTFSLTFLNQRISDCFGSSSWLTPASRQSFWIISSTVVAVLKWEKTTGIVWSLLSRCDTSTAIVVLPNPGPPQIHTTAFSPSFKNETTFWISAFRAVNIGNLSGKKLVGCRSSFRRMFILARSSRIWPMPLRISWISSGIARKRSKSSILWEHSFNAHFNFFSFCSCSSIALFSDECSTFILAISSLMSFNKCRCNSRLCSSLSTTLVIPVSSKYLRYPKHFPFSTLGDTFSRSSRKSRAIKKLSSFLSSVNFCCGACAQIFLTWERSFFTRSTFTRILQRNASSFIHSSTLRRDERSVDLAFFTVLWLAPSAGMKNFATSQWSSDHLALLQFLCHEGLLPFLCDTSSFTYQHLHDLHRSIGLILSLQSSGLLQLPIASKSSHSFTWNALTISSTYAEIGFWIEWIISPTVSQLPCSFDTSIWKPLQ